MAQKSLLLSIVCFLFYNISYCKEQSCIQENPCLCRFNELQKIDLWPLANDGVFFAASATAKYYLSVCEEYQGTRIICGSNPNTTTYCEKPFSLCKCDTVNNLTTKLSIKDRSFVDTATDPYTEKFVYTNGTNVTASVILACSQLVENWLFPLTNNTDQLVFLSKYACVTTEDAGISTGTTLLIIVFFFLLFYFVFGALLLRFLRGARGIEMVPNLGFWRDLPCLVRDGIVFLLNGCKPTALVTSEAYDRI